MANASRAVTIEDLRRMAVARWPRFIGDYVERGAGDGEGVRRNVNALRAHRFRPRILVPVDPVDTSIELFGRRYACPFGISAVGLSGVYRRHADVLLAQAAREADIPFILSGASTSSLRSVMRAAPSHTWYQLYGARDPLQTDRMVRQAQDAGIDVLVFTVDYPVPPQSEVAARTGVSLGAGPTWRAWPRVLWDAAMHPRWLAEFVRWGGMPTLESWSPYAPAGSSAQQVAKYFAANWLGNQTWTDLDRVRELWRGKLIVKGIVSPQDAIKAFDAGADAVTVSNHGANKLDCMPGCIDSLQALKAGVPAGAALFFDGGIRRGSDVAVATALGAAFCFVGRATLYGVGAGGYDGALRAIEILRSELRYTMAMIGCSTVADIGADRLVP